MSQKLPYMLRCDLCHGPTHNILYANIDGIRYKFCSVAHAKAAENNYKLKKEKGVIPSEEPTNENTYIPEDGD